MTTILCTLYNSLYLDKGLVLYDSLCECAKDFKLYVLCMDEKCYEVLSDLKQEHHIPVRLADIETGDGDLLAAKANRPMGEYCWTCSSSFIRYILQHFNEDNCTYIDADMCFYNDPKVLIDEMIDAGKSVMVVPHRFPKGKDELAGVVGNYCVEFNTFLNTPQSLGVLDYWRNRCLECCSNLGDGIHWGDQKYLDEIVEKFDCVHVCRHNGAGVAPWNITSYTVVDGEKCLEYKPLKETVKVVFYHYQNITYLSRKLVAIGISKRVPIDTKVLSLYYRPYLVSIDHWKSKLLSSFDVWGFIGSHPQSDHLTFGFKQTRLGKYCVFLYKLLFGNKYLVSL